MRPNTEKERAMSVAEATEDIRGMAAHLVDIHAPRSGGRMPAYADVARLTCTSAAWLRRFIGRRPDAALSFAAAFNIYATYHRICDLIDARADAERDRADALLRRRTGAHFQVLGSAVPRVAQASPGATVDPASSPRSDARD